MWDRGATSIIHRATTGELGKGDPRLIYGDVMIDKQMTVSS